MARFRPSAAAIAIFLTLAGSACVSARMSDHVSDNLFRDRRYDEAAERLKKGLARQGVDGKDVLLYLLDVGLSLHTAGKYAESNKYFLEADKIAEIKDYTSLLNEGATLITGENVSDYKGEDFEKVLINTYLAMNYALMGNYEDALVEARRVNQKLYMMVTLGKRKYKQNAFARYLSAILYEATGDFNDAYVDYKNTHALVPDFPGLGRDLWRCAAVLGVDDDKDQWDSEYHLTAQDHAQAKLALPRSPKGELVVLYENGISPIKRPNPRFRLVPRFFPRFNPVLSADIYVNGQKMGTTAVLEDIEATAIENLEEKYSGMIAKRLAGAVTKDLIAYEVEKRTRNPLLGALTRFTLFASDQADLRSWNLLPRDLQISRILLDPGTYQVRVSPNGDAPLPDRTVQIERGKKTLVDFRFMP